MIVIQLFFTFMKIGLFTLGSGYSMLVLVQRYIVDTYHWITMEELADIVGIAEVTPGPFIVNLATFVGTKVAGLKGAICSTLGLVIVPFIALYIIALKYQQFKGNPVIQNLLTVIRPMALAFIVVAILRLSRMVTTDLKTTLIFVGVILVTFFTKVNPVFTVITCVILGFILR